jgi:hypothetical protein
MFRLTAEEGRGQHRKYLPYAFTEQGVAMLSSVLRSARAIAVNIQIMRAFVRMRELLISNRELAEKLDQLEARLEKKLASHDGAITRSGPSPMAAIGCLNHEDFWRQSARNATARAYERKSVDNAAKDTTGVGSAPWKHVAHCSRRSPATLSCAPASPISICGWPASSC